MAMVLIDQGRSEVVAAPVIRYGHHRRAGADFRQHELGRSQRTSLLLRARLLAAPMEIIEERTMGPSVGQRKH